MFGQGTYQRKQGLLEVDSLEEAEFIRFTSKLPVPTHTDVVRDTYACISNMNDYAVVDSRIDCNI